MASGKFAAHGGFCFAIPKHTLKISLRVLAPAIEGYALAQSNAVW